MSIQIVFSDGPKNYPEDFIRSFKTYDFVLQVSGINTITELKISSNVLDTLKSLVDFKDIDLDDMDLNELAKLYIAVNYLNNEDLRVVIGTCLADRWVKNHTLQEVHDIAGTGKIVSKEEKKEYYLHAPVFK